MAQLPIDFRRGGLQAAQSVRATPDLASGEALKNLGRGFTDLGRGLNVAEQADQNLRLKQYVNEVSRLKEDAARGAIDGSQADGSDTVDVWKDLDKQIEVARPDGMNRGTFKRAQIALEGVNGQIGKNLAGYSAGKQKEFAGKRMDFVDGQNWDKAQQVNSKFSFHAYTESLRNVATDGFLAMGISESQRDEFINRRISERKAQFVDNYGKQSIAHAEEMQEALTKGSFTVESVFDDENIPPIVLTGGDESSLSANDTEALRNELGAYIHKEGMRIVSSEMESLNAAESLIGSTVKPNIDLEALSERLDASLPDTWGDVKKSIMDQANAVNVRGEVAFKNKSIPQLDIAAKEAEIERRLSAAEFLSPLEKKAVQDKADTDRAALQKITQRRINFPHQATLDANETLQGLWSQLTQLNAEQEQLTTDSPRYQELKEVKQRIGRQYAQGMIQVGTYVLGDIDEVRLEGPEQTKALVAAYDQFLRAGNSDALAGLFLDKEETYGEDAAALVLQQAFGTRANEVMMLAGMSSTNPEAFSSAMRGIQNWETNKKSIGDTGIKKIAALMPSTLDVLLQTYPDGKENATYNAYHNLITKMTASLLQSGQVDSAEQGAQQAYASIFADKKVFYDPPGMFDWFAEDQSAVMVDQKIAKINPGIGPALFGINTHNTALRDAMDAFIMPDAQGNETAWNFFQPGVPMTPEMKAEIRDGRLQSYASDDGKGITITIGNNKEPLIGPDGRIMVIPWDILNTLGTDAVYRGSRDRGVLAPLNKINEFRDIQRSRWNDAFAKMYPRAEKGE